MMKHYILVPCLLFVSTLISSGPVLGQGTCSTCNLWNRAVVRVPARVVARAVQAPAAVLAAPVVVQTPCVTEAVVVYEPVVVYRPVRRRLFGRFFFRGRVAQQFQYFRAVPVESTSAISVPSPVQVVMSDWPGWYYIN